MNVVEVKRAYIEKLSDKGLRHRSPVPTPEEFKAAFLEVGREFAYATSDNSWGELEKLFHIMAMELFDYRHGLKKGEHY